MSDVFDTHAKSYSEDIDEVLGKYGANHDFFTQHKAVLIQDLLSDRSIDPQSVQLLDVGCGVGKIHRYFQGVFNSVSGVDISETSLEMARESFPDFEYSFYDGQKLPFADEAFDLTIAICVFHHVPPAQWQGLASEMLRVLRPGGLSIVIEHNPYNPLTRHIVNTCPLDEDAILLRPKNLRRFFNAAGAAKVVTKTILTVPPKAKLTKAVDKALGSLPFGAQYYLTADKVAR